MDGVPILYSFRRCPYAIRARLALAVAGLRPGSDLELREVSLRARPPELLESSPKATVPVLVLPHGQVLDESLAIMGWALLQHDPHDWLRRGSGAAALAARGAIDVLLGQNDGPFKWHLDRYKYADRYPGERRDDHRRACLALLRSWTTRLSSGDWLLGDHPSLADLALLPFVRQFRLADPEGFDAEGDLGDLQAWLARFLASPELAAVMDEPWGLRHSWRSPRWLYHLALAEEWRAARSEGVYRRSTRGLSLQQVGFIHASSAHQVDATWRRFYADAGSVVLLSIDPQALAAAGVSVRFEAPPTGDELFPHLYGPLPLEAVVMAEPYRP